ncbi:23S rRNA (pseudouridine(1915)-N(3))-methyltransferase RlmH [Bacteroidales bacterium OttesenSCG-928-C19]|nr:23S rRNA (pseudouridine(1915)-N(3))-methyltransferase RlmH [Bacteroidales bacterium OttesenSCG-928-C19]
MNIKLLCISKTESGYLKEGINLYLNRLQHYINFEIIEVPELKNTKNISPIEVKNKETELILKHAEKADKVVLLDENGKMYRSVEFSDYIQKKLNSNVKTLMFVVGGAYGFSSVIKEKYPEKLALSPMTFSHQMIRLLFVEQIYRAFTIMKGEPYHNE